MKKDEQTHDEVLEEIEYEEDQGANLVKKQRAKLKKCEEEKKEYLDGWQRAKAEAVNAKRAEAVRLATSTKRAVDNFVAELLPALDSFDMAFQDASWEQADPTWRKGVEYIQTQVLQVLASHGIEPVGVEGETFDPLQHEAASKESGDTLDTIVRVLRRGYRRNDEIIRPARVVVAE